MNCYCILLLSANIEYTNDHKVTYKQKYFSQLLTTVSKKFVQNNIKCHVCIESQIYGPT